MLSRHLDIANGPTRIKRDIASAHPDGWRPSKMSRIRHLIICEFELSASEVQREREGGGGMTFRGMRQDPVGDL